MSSPALPPKSSPFPPEMTLWVIFALAKLGIHLLSAQGYGIFRDEFYFIDCGKHLDFGYVDHPPMVAVSAWVSHTLFGDSILGLRLFPALAGAFKMLMVGWLTREIGGGRMAQALACLAFLVTPIFMAADSMLTIVTYEHLFWLGACCILARIISTQNNQLWLLFGLCAGLAMLTKYSFAYLAAATLLGLLLTPQRKLLWSKSILGAGALALILFLPNLIWQIRHDWATFAFLSTVHQYDHSRISFLEFTLGQILYHHPLLFPLWLAGLGYFFLTPKGKPYRLFGWSFVFTYLFFLFMQGKIYYLSPVYPALFAGGAILLESGIQRLGRLWLGWLIGFVILTGGIVLAPIFLPILPFPLYRAYVGHFTRQLPNAHELDQLFIDRLGWEEQVAQIAQIFQTLTPDEQRCCMILATDYGEAGALNYYGKQYGLPTAVSGHNSYFFWGPGETTLETAIVYGQGLDEEEVYQCWEEVQRVTHLKTNPGPPWEQNLPVYLCRKPKLSMQDFWPLTRKGF